MSGTVTVLGVECRRAPGMESVHRTGWYARHGQAHIEVYRAHNSARAAWRAYVRAYLVCEDGEVTHGVFAEGATLAELEWRLRAMLRVQAFDGLPVEDAP